jgi:hypothetical protein
LKFSIADKIIPILRTLALELGKLSWVALVAMLCVGGVLLLMGNEHGAKKICKNAIYGFAVIQIASMLL